MWTCQNLQCTCRPNTSFCGAVPATNLTAVINALSGTLTVSCAPPNNDTRTTSCSFGQSTLQALFGSGGLPLDGCTFGECVRQSVIDTNGNSTAVSSVPDGSQLGGGVIAGLAVVGGLLFLALSLLALGFWKQRSAKLRGPKNISVGGIAVAWDDVSYTLPPTGEFASKIFHRSEHDDKVVLDSVSGRVLPGQMMAILGPSGMSGCLPLLIEPSYATRCR